MTIRRHVRAAAALPVLMVALAIGRQPSSARQASGAERFAALARASLAEISGELAVPGLRDRVEVIRDRWGVPHIYAANTDDLFFAQGYVMAQDRLWQMEMWRREREGRLAEILGPSAVARDRQARLLAYRGPMDDREWASYHPEGRRIFTAFAAGVNAYVATHRDRLPVEFTVTGITPDPWTAETCVRRTAAIGDAAAELALARTVARVGVLQANRQRAPDPWDDLEVPDGLDVTTIGDDIGSGRGGGAGGGAIRPALIDPYRSWAGAPPTDAPNVPSPDPPGSNNWVVNGSLSATGKPIVSNDPHRNNTNPSLRYIVHLVAPGWNVIGAGEPPFVGVAIGHNEWLGWGLTIVGTDQEDAYVEDVNPANPNEVKWNGGWEPIRIVREEIRVKGEAPRAVELKFTRHGPVFAEDPARHRLYALRSALLEPGTAPYLGGLRLAQARNCREFLDAAAYWKAPTENLICGDVAGHIAWQASALTPSRQGWVGRLPVPGDGRYEWNGFRQDLPREYDPARGFIATANNNINPPGYAPPLMFKTATGVEFERITRVLQMVRPGRRYTVEDMRAMQLDALSLRAKHEIQWFSGWAASTPAVERARQAIAAWDAVLSRESQAAAIYSAWRSASTADERDPSRPITARQPALEASLARAIDRLTSTQGPDWSAWRWGRMHTQAYPHAFLAAFDLPPIERRGGPGTVAADGATYREVLDVADWDRSIVTNVPGQSGQPESPYYRNLLALFATDTYFPLAYSRAAVERAAGHRLTLKTTSLSSSTPAP